MELKRKYELSLWTLQDGFISTLKPYELEAKNRIQKPNLKAKDDGTREFTCTIPMYIHDAAANEWVENPIWYNVLNGNLIANMRKFKIIFDKYNENGPTVYEMLITKVTETHEGMEKWCEVSCEGLDFHELGKIGFKTELNDETFNEEWNEWADSDKGEDDEPHCNIQYWLEKLQLNKIGWDYSIQMDWSCYANSNLNTDKVYEDVYVNSWSYNNGSATPMGVVDVQEKYRLIDVKESNYYNITQTIAKTFGVYCRYERTYNQNLQCTSKVAVFYNNFLQEQEGAIDINYAYDTAEISREMDSTDLVSKMFVRSLNDENMDSGWASITDTEVNKSKEDYILNFDYLRLIGTISEEQYAAIDTFENEVGAINKQLIEIDEEILDIQNQLPELKAKKQVFENSIPLDNERIAAAKDKLKAITNDTGIITLTAANPAIAYVIKESGSDKLFINIKQEGVLPGTLEVYSSYAAATQVLSGKIENYSLVYDEYGNLIKITNLVGVSEANSVYLIYSYDPKLTQENVIQAWSQRLLQDTTNFDNLTADIEDLEEKLGDLLDAKDELEEQKTQKLNAFVALMGPALREGYWQPEDSYAGYGDKYRETINFNNGSSSPSGNISFVWDTQFFEGEQLAYFEDSINQNRIYYPYVDLTNVNDSDFLEHPTQYSFVFDAVLDSQGQQKQPPIKRTAWAIGSKSQLAYLNDKPVLLLIAINELVLDNGQTYASYFGNRYPSISKFSIIDDGSSITTKEVSVASVTVNDNSQYEVQYPRIRFTQYNLKTADDEVIVKLGSNTLSRYADYSLLRQGRIQNSTTTYDLHYYITFKFDAFMREVKRNGATSATIAYTIPNTPTAIYLDARQVARENAFPKVSYSVTPQFLKQSFLDVSFKALGRILNINDSELKFDHVRGYISEIDLDLDLPQNDSIIVTNYRTKFEDLFSTIVAQTEEMKKSSYVVELASAAITPKGEISDETIIPTMHRADLNWAFNQGTLTINEEDGIWATSDSGVVALRGGGIFTATEKDGNDNWIWNTGILPSGINADLITTGQLDTNKIQIFGGDDLKLILDDRGLIAYKGIADEVSLIDNDEDLTSEEKRIKKEEYSTAVITYSYPELDYNQYVIHNGQGLFLRAKAGAIVYDRAQEEYTITNSDVDRVAITWDGLTLRNWNNNRTLWMDPDTGDLHITGIVNATGLNIVSNGQTAPLQIGGTNMIRLADSCIQFNPENKGMIFVEDEKIYYSLSQKIIKLMPHNYSSTSTTGQIRFISQIPLQLNKQYTLSFWIWTEEFSEGNIPRVVIQLYYNVNNTSNVYTVHPNDTQRDDGVDVNPYTGNIISMNPTLTPTYHTYTFYLDEFPIDVDGIANLRFNTNTNNTGYICVSDVKLEEGNVATTWSAHPEELRAGSGLIINENEIYMHSDLIRINPNTYEGGLIMDREGAIMDSLIVTKHFEAPGLVDPYVPSNLIGIPAGVVDREITQSLNAYFSQLNNKILSEETYIYIKNSIAENSIIIEGISGGANELRIINSQNGDVQNPQYYSIITNDFYINNVSVPLRFENCIFYGRVIVNNSYVYFYQCTFYGPGNTLNNEDISLHTCLYISRRGGVLLHGCELHNAYALITVNHVSDLSMHDNSGGYTIINNTTTPDCEYFLCVRGGNAKISGTYPYSNHGSEQDVLNKIYRDSNGALIDISNIGNQDTPQSGSDTPINPTYTNKTITLNTKAIDGIRTYFNYPPNYPEYKLAANGGFGAIGYIYYTKYVDASVYTRLNYDFSNSLNDATSITEAKLKLTRSGGNIGTSEPIDFFVSLSTNYETTSSYAGSFTTKGRGETFEIDITELINNNLANIKNNSNYGLILYSTDNSKLPNKDYSENYGGFNILENYKPQLIITYTPSNP